MNRFRVIIEKTHKNFSAYSPDLPGCVATGVTREEAKKKMKEAIELHIQGLKDEETALLALPGFRDALREAKEDIRKGRTVSLKKIKRNR